MLEVVSPYDPLLAEHLNNVKRAQMEKKKDYRYIICQPTFKMNLFYVVLSMFLNAY